MCRGSSGGGRAVTCVCVEGYMIRNTCWVGIVKCSELQRHVELFIDNILVMK